MRPATPIMHEEEIVDQILAGGDSENRALHEIYETNYNSIFAMVVRNSGSSEDAKDVFQEGVIELYKNIHSKKYRGHSLLTTYLYSICKFIWLKKLRKKKKTIELEQVAKAYPYDDDQHLMIDRSKAVIISELFDQLGETCKTILTLFYYERQSIEEILKQTGFKDEQNVRNKKYKCMKALKAILDDHPVLKKELRF
jgi:RNA polymerase sigma factor (sigma-70 family)